jgi:TRAP-type mannitol/chloroaromatic compound transport system permease small subunit
LAGILKICGWITKLNEIVATKIAIWLIYPLIAIISFDVIMRYVFIKPTVWAFDFSWILYGLLVLLGGGWVYGIDGHVRADVFYNHFPLKFKNIVMIICHLVLFFPAFGGMFYACLLMTVNAYTRHETTASTIMHLPTWPVKAIMTFAIGLLLLQGLAKVLEMITELIRDFRKGEVIK